MIELPQVAALEALSGVAIDAALLDEIEALSTAGDHQGIADLLGARQPDVVGSVTVEQVFDAFFASGDYLRMKQAQIAGDPRAVLAFATLDDTKRLGPGLVNLQLPATAMLLDALQQEPALLGAAGRAALIAAATRRPAPIPHAAITAALET